MVFWCILLLWKYVGFSVLDLFYLAVLKVSVREEKGNTVDMTVRLYGPNTDYVINRERELQVSQ